MDDPPDRCPNCGSPKVARIHYGRPVFSDELRRMLGAGEVVLGGCLTTGDVPAWECQVCLHRWGNGRWPSQTDHG
jgi:hypothetical protein